MVWESESIICFLRHAAPIHYECHELGDHPSWPQEPPPKAVITPLRLLHKYRRTTTTIIYVSVAVASYSLAFVLRFPLADVDPGRFLWGLLLLVAIRVGFALATRLGVGSWRYVGISDLFRLTLATTAGSILLYAISWGGAPVYAACAPLRHRAGVVAHG